MENTNLPAEIHPLKSEEGKVPGRGEANCAVKVLPLKTPGRLSRLRTAAFFISLFLCLITVFALSLLVPCPVKPTPQKGWNRTYENTVAYPFLITRDVDGDDVQDILFVLQAAGLGNASVRAMNTTCADEGFASPCAILVALSGTHGNTLWQIPVAQEILEIDCTAKSDNSPACLVVGNPNIITLLDLKKGENVWKQNVSFASNATMIRPSLIVPDVDGDGVSDFLIFTYTGEKIKSWFFSGKHGALLGAKGSFKIRGWITHFLEKTKKNAFYVLFCTSQNLYGYSVKELYHSAVRMLHQKDYSLTDPFWEVAIDRVSHVVSLLSSSEILYMNKMPAYSQTNILLTRSLMMELLNGQNLGSMWANNISNPLSEPAFGSYTRDTVDILIETRVTALKKKVRIVLGVSGNIEWELDLIWRAGNPPPDTLRTADYRSMFFFWGTNETNPIQEQHLYLFHPTFKNVLLDMKSMDEPIVVFKAVLLERHRHPCYLLLTGQQAGGVPGRVTIYKHRLKEDIKDSQVLWINQVVEDTDENVKDHFLRLRYHTDD